MERTLLLSFAHPDDETFYCAGTVLRYREQGVRVVLLCATLGERGSQGRPPVCAAEELPAVRRCELDSALRILGIETVHLLGYRDQELAKAPPSEIRLKIAGYVRQYRPDVVITFDPNGGSGHADHVAISRFTNDSVNAAADERWDTGLPAYGVPRLLWTPGTQPWMMPSAAGQAALPGIDFLFDIEPWKERKRAALRAHSTQTPSIDRVFFNPPDSELRLGVEAFRQAWGPALPRRPADDLFVGLPETEGESVRT